MAGKILVIGQQVTLRLTLCSWLEALLPTVRTIDARDETVGIALAQSRSPLMIIYDAGFPGAYSLDAISCLRKAVSHIPLLVLTTYESETYYAQALQAGANACLPKDMIYSDHFVLLLTKLLSRSYQINPQEELNRA